jgi:hypothetical protein
MKKNRGKLVLIESNETDLDKAMTKTLVHIHQGQGNVLCCNPIIVSETEKVKVGDSVYNPKIKSINKVVKDDAVLETLGLKDWQKCTLEAANHYKHPKVLLKSFQFSGRDLELIESGEVEDGSEVLIRVNGDDCVAIIDFIPKLTVRNLDFELNNLLNGILCRRDIKIKADSNSIAEFVTKFIKTKLK